MSIDDSLDDCRRENGALENSADVALGHTGLTSEGAEGLHLAGRKFLGPMASACNGLDNRNGWLAFASSCLTGNDDTSPPCSPVDPHRAGELHVVLCRGSGSTTTRALAGTVAQQLMNERLPVQGDLQS